jgi:uncharacterized membrane protein YwzB
MTANKMIKKATAVKKLLISASLEVVRHVPVTNFFLDNLHI